MKTYKHVLLAASLLPCMVVPCLASAKGSEIKFESSVSSISLNEDGFHVVTITVKGFEVPVLVDGETKIEDGGDRIGAEDLEEGDSVKIEAFFEDSAIVAEEIRILERDWEQFRLKGEITDVEFGATPTATSSVEATRISLLGVDVYVDDATKITFRGKGNRDDYSHVDLTPGDEADVSGVYLDSVLWADRIKVGERELGKIEVEGEILSLTDDGFVVDLRESGQLRIIVDDSTVVEGEIAEGSKVKIEGMLNESLRVVAYELKVEGEGENKDQEGDDKKKDKDD